MTVNITINADTLELTNVDGMTRIVCNGEPANPEKETRDTLAARKTKTKVLEDAVCAQMDKMTKNWEEQKDKPNSDWIVRRKLKPQRMSELKQIEDGLYFRRERPGYPWFPWMKNPSTWTISATDELIGPITPDMFL